MRINSHSLEEVAICDNLEFVHDEVDTAFCEEDLVGLDGTVEQLQITLDDCLRHVGKLHQVVLLEEGDLWHLTLGSRNAR